MPRRRDHVLVPSGPRVVLGELTEEGASRLVGYCWRVSDEPREPIDRPVCGRVRPVPFVGRWLRAVVWDDVEIREALLRMDFKALLAAMQAKGWGDSFNLLDLMTAMTLEAEVRGHE
jgi:hypothetical protein